MYNIPVSVSLAETKPQIAQVTSGSTFNFSSPFARGSIFDLEQTPASTATATSSASTGGAAVSETADSGNVAQERKAEKEPNWFLIGVTGIVGLLLLVIVWKKF